MDTGIVYEKTEKGEQEINGRTSGLSVSLRHVLVFVDGKSTVQRIMDKAAGLPDIAQSLAELARQGFIRPIMHSIAQIKEELIKTARETLGENAEKVIRKIKEAPETSEALSLTIANCKKLVKLVIDEAKADELAVKCSEIVNRYKL